MANDLPSNVVVLFPGKEPPKPKPERSALYRWQKLALTFPSVVAAVAGHHWPTEKLTPGSLDAYIATVHAHNGLRWSASFLLAVWKPGARWHNVPAWNPVAALHCWDSKHRKAWQDWCADPKVF